LRKSYRWPTTSSCVDICVVLIFLYILTCPHQEIRKAEKVHTLTTLRSRISLIEKYESGHDGVSSMEPSRSVPQVSMEPTLSVSSPTSRHSPLHISFNGNRRPECDDDEGVVTTRSLVGGSVDEQNCFRMSMGEGAKEAEKEFGVSRVVSGSRMSPISIQPDDDTSTNNVRESLLHEVRNLSCMVYYV
jgi:hypothetical protein